MFFIKSQYNTVPLTCDLPADNRLGGSSTSQVHASTSFNIPNIGILRYQISTVVAELNKNECSEFYLYYTIQFWDRKFISVQGISIFISFLAMHHVIYGIEHHNYILHWFKYVLWQIVEYQLGVHVYVLFRYVFGLYLYDKIPVYKWHIEIVWNSNVCDNDASDFLYSQDTLEVHLVQLLKTRIKYCSRG